MFQGSSFLRLLCLFGIAFVLLMVIQFTELPNGRFLSSIVSTGKYTLSSKRNFGSKNDSDSGTAGNATSTYFNDGVTNEGQINRTAFDDLLGKSNGMDSSEDLKDSANRTSMEKANTPKLDDSVGNVTKKKEIEDFSLSSGSNVMSGSVSEALTVASTSTISIPAAPPNNFDLVSPVESVDPGISSMNDVTSKLKTDGEKSLIQRNFSLPIAVSPQPDLSILHRFSITEMNELLLQSRSFPHLVVSQRVCLIWSLLFILRKYSFHFAFSLAATEMVFKC